jgi:hypothetical protein
MQVHLIYNSKIKKFINGKEKETSAGDLSIKRGGTFTISFKVNGDYSECIPKSEIRTNYLDAGGSIITSFEFLPITYIEETNETVLTLRLKGGVTTNLPVTAYQGLSTQTPSVSNCLVYDVELIDPNDSSNVYKIIEPSFVQVTHEVTNGN